MVGIILSLSHVAYVRIAMIAFFYAIGFFLEWLAPVSAVTMRNRLFNIACGVFYQAGDLLSSICVAWLLYPYSEHPLISTSFSDHRRIVFAILLAFGWLTLRDFFFYWFHRWQHVNAWLWPVHALHHSDEHMNVTTALRAHWLEMPLNSIFVTAPIVLLFRPPIITIPVAYTLMYFVVYLIHMNVRLSSGALAWVLVSPQIHRIHHSRQPEHLNKNFAVMFPLWDVIFGTYYKPALDEYPATGLSSGESITTLKRAVLMPFQDWAKMLRHAPESVQIMSKL